MATTPLSGFDKRARKLTTDEINNILEELPLVIGADQETAKVAQQSMMANLREQLEEIEITPLAIPELKAEINRQFERSRVDPGDDVGVHAAEALGGPLMQMSLNSFHTAGASKAINGGVDRIRELIDVTPNPKNPSCSIYFKDPNLTFDDILTKKRGDIVGIYVSDIIQDYDVDSPEQLMPEPPWWYDMFKTTIRDDFGQPQFILRLFLNVSTMYAYRIQMQDVAEAIERVKEQVICVYSPLSEGILDIYPIEKTLRAELEHSEVITNEYAALIFIATVLRPALDQIQIKGIDKITGLYPVTVPILQIVKSEIIETVGGNIWFLQYNKIRMKITGITAQHLIKLIQVAGMTVLPIEEARAQDFLRVQVPSDESPRQRIFRLIEEDKKDERKYEDREKKRGVLYPRRPPTPISVAANFVYADTDGSNLKVLLARDDIDSTHTVSNNVHEIVNALGIEAARNFLIREFIMVIQIDQSYINPRHIILLVDFMTNQGRLVPITYSGIQRQPIGALAKASFQRPMDVFIQAAAFGQKEEAKSVSTSIMLGKRARIGTGYVDVLVNKEKEQEYEKQLKTQAVPAKVNVSEFRDAIAKMDEITFGTGAMTLEGAEMEAMFGETGELRPSLTLPIPPPVTIADRPARPARPPLELKGKPVVSQLLQKVPETLQEVISLPVPTTTISIQPLIVAPQTEKLPTLPPALPPALPLPPIQLPPYPGGVGVPQSLLSELQTAQTLKLPEITIEGIPVARPGIVQRRVQPASLAAFLAV